MCPSSQVRARPYDRAGTPSAEAIRWQPMSTQPSAPADAVPQPLRASATVAPRRARRRRPSRSTDLRAPDPLDLLDLLPSQAPAGLGAPRRRARRVGRDAAGRGRRRRPVRRRRAGVAGRARARDRPRRGAGARHRPGGVRLVRVRRRAPPAGGVVVVPQRRRRPPRRAHLADDDHHGRPAARRAAARRRRRPPRAARRPRRRSSTPTAPSAPTAGATSSRAASPRSRPATWRRWCSPATCTPAPSTPSTCAGRSSGSPTQYPSCWTFSVDGLVGATPELLVRSEKGLVTSRVLAGTIRRTGDDAADLARAAILAHSSKDLEEHEYAVTSVAHALEPFCSSTNVPDVPFVLHLPNVLHLASDVTGVLARPAATRRTRRRSRSPRRCTRPPPSAARPTVAARELIRSIEGMDRAPLRRAGRLVRRRRRRRVGHRAALRAGRRRRPAPRPAVRRLRRRRRVRPGRRAGGVRGQAGPHAVRARPGRQHAADVPAEGAVPRPQGAWRPGTACGPVRTATSAGEPCDADGRVRGGTTDRRPPAVRGDGRAQPWPPCCCSGTTPTAASGLSPSGMPASRVARAAGPGREPAGAGPAAVGSLLLAGCLLGDAAPGRTASVTSTSERLAVADDRQRDLRAGRERPHVRGERLGAADGLAVDRDDRVLLLQLGLRRPASRR